MTSDKSKPTYALVLQGGGALGAYHIGAYEALAERDLLPDWICGISIGAINAAIIAGNAPEQGLARLEAFWEFIAWPAVLEPFGGDALHTLYNAASNVEAVLFGQPNFFAPRPINPYFALPGPAATSFYDTTPLRASLTRFVEFDRIKNGKTRLSLGATDIASGELLFFDNRRETIAAEHVMASAALPPGFPPVEIGGRFFWDGGCVSNTPLEAMLAEEPPGHTVVFMIDLWNAAGAAPRTMNDVLWRQRQIQYASRTASHIDAVATKVKLGHALRRLKESGAPAEAAASAPPPAAQRLDIVHIVYHPAESEIPSSGAEFSPASLRARRDAGYADMKQALAAAPWLQAEAPAHLGARIHRVSRQQVTSEHHADLRHTSGLVAATPVVEAPASPRQKRA